MQLKDALKLRLSSLKTNSPWSTEISFVLIIKIISATKHLKFDFSALSLNHQEKESESRNKISNNTNTPIFMEQCGGEQNSRLWGTVYAKA